MVRIGGRREKEMARGKIAGEGGRGIMADRGGVKGEECAEYGGGDGERSGGREGKRERGGVC